MTPRQIVEEWVKRFNAGDADGLAELYHDDAVNHQVTQQPVEGRSAIRSMFEQEFAVADMVCIPEVIHEAGQVAILEWRDHWDCGDAGSSPSKMAASHFSEAIGTSYRS
jgi:uncharacterized protein (TIGR02246 family)